MASGRRLLQLVGIAAACAGIVLAARESGDADAVGLKRVHVCVWFALLAALGGGSQLVSLDRAAEHDALVAVLLMRGTSVAIFTVAGLIVRPAVARETLPLLALIGILDTTAVVLFAAAAAEGLLSVSPSWPASTRSSPSGWRGCGWASGWPARRPPASAWRSPGSCWSPAGSDTGQPVVRPWAVSVQEPPPGTNPALVSTVATWSRPAASVKDSWSLQTVTPVARCLFGRFRPAPAARVSLPAKLSSWVLLGSPRSASRRCRS